MRLIIFIWMSFIGGVTGDTRNVALIQWTVPPWIIYEYWERNNIWVSAVVCHWKYSSWIQSVLNYMLNAKGCSKAENFWVFTLQKFSSQGVPGSSQALPAPLCKTWPGRPLCCKFCAPRISAPLCIAQAALMAGTSQKNLKIKNFKF